MSEEYGFVSGEQYQKMAADYAQVKAALQAILDWHDGLGHALAGRPVNEALYQSIQQIHELRRTARQILKQVAE